MDKTLKLALNRYATTPTSLRRDPSSNAPVDVIRVDLATLFHHYYLDSFGTSPPDPDPARFEPTQFLLPCEEFRFQGNGYGTSPARRPNVCCPRALTGTPDTKRRPTAPKSGLLHLFEVSDR
jgi:hypothetical protein